VAGSNSFGPGWKANDLTPKQSLRVPPDAIVYFDYITGGNNHEKYSPNLDLSQADGATASRRNRRPQMKLSTAQTIILIIFLSFCVVALFNPAFTVRPQHQHHDYYIGDGGSWWSPPKYYDDNGTEWTAVVDWKITSKIYMTIIILFIVSMGIAEYFRQKDIRRWKKLEAMSD